MSKPNGMIVWQGPSNIDGSDIVVILTGLEKPSDNGKTGPMVQSWILNVNTLPTEAVKSGENSAICGNCPLLADSSEGRKRSCYVNVGQAPQGIYRAFLRGSYPRPSYDTLGEALRGKELRIGSYGDPAAVPAGVWHALLEFCSDWTSYTHQHESPRVELQHLAMASVETVKGRTLAKSKGYRTFRVGFGILPGEKPCPAGPKRSQVTCKTCPLKCNGGAGPDIVIPPHGAGAKNHPSGGIA